MLYSLFRQTEFDGVVVFIFLVISLYRIYSEKMPVKKAVTYFSVSLLLYVVLQYGTYLLPISQHPHHYWYNFLLQLFIPLITSEIFLGGYFAGKLIYTLFYVSFIQLYKIVWSPLYMVEGTIPQSLYIFWDYFSFILLIVLLYLFFMIARKSIPKIHANIRKKLVFLTI